MLFIVGEPYRSYEGFTSEITQLVSKGDKLYGASLRELNIYDLTKVYIYL
jgi:hypothetical protein